MTDVQEFQPTRSAGRPLWLSTLAIFSLLLGIITTIPQFYYVLFGLHLVTNGVSYWASNLPYLIYPLWLMPVLLFQRSLFAQTIRLDASVVDHSKGLSSAYVPNA